LGVSNIRAACQVQTGEVVYFDILGYIVPAGFDVFPPNRPELHVQAVALNAKMPDTMIAVNVFMFNVF